MSRDLFRQGAVLFVAVGLMNICSYLLQIAGGRLLGPEEYGILGAFVAAYGVISVPAGALQTVISRRSAVLRDGPQAAVAGLLRGTIARALGIGLVLSALTALALPLIASFLHLPSWHGASVLVLFMAIGLVSPATRGVLQGTRRFTGLAVVLVTMAATRLASGVGLMVLGWGAQGGAAGYAVGDLVGMVLALALLRTVWRTPEPDSRPLAGVLGETQLTAAVLGGMAAVISIDAVLVRHYFPTEASGHYAGAWLMGRVVYYLPIAVQLLAFPLFAGSRDNRTRRRALRLALVSTGVLGFAAATAIAIAGDRLLTVVFGPDYVDGTPAMRLLVFAMAFHTLSTVLIYFHLASRPTLALGVIPALAAQVALIMAFHDSIEAVSTVVLAVSIALLGYNLTAVKGRIGRDRPPDELAMIAPSGT